MLDKETAIHLPNLKKGQSIYVLEYPIFPDLLTQPLNQSELPPGIYKASVSGNGTPQHIKADLDPSATPFVDIKETSRQVSCQQLLAPGRVYDILKSMGVWRNHLIKPLFPSKKIDPIIKTEENNFIVAVSLAQFVLKEILDQKNIF